MKQLGKYEIIELLGSGATADVYRAHDESMGRDVALKIFKPALVADATTFARFVQEAQAAAGLFHENIATALDSGEIDGNYYIAMRYATGQSLDRLLKEGGALPWDEALRMTQQIGSALNYAHEHGFLHRDVKPANIIRSNAGNYVLTDFGLAKAMFSSGVTTHTGAVLGTPSYIPPEIWEGQEASAATDEYSLACVLYEALTGITLFTGSTPPAVMGSHFKERRFQTQWPAGVPNGMTDVMAKALAVLPENRYGSVLEFTAELTRLGASQMQKAEVKAPAVKSEPVKATAEPVQRPVPQPAQTPPGQQLKPLATKAHRKGKIWPWILLGLLVMGFIVCNTVPVFIAMFSSLMAPPATEMPTAAPQVIQEGQPTMAPTVVPTVVSSQPIPTKAPAALSSTTPAPILLEICRANTTGLCIADFSYLGAGKMVINLRKDFPFAGIYVLKNDHNEFICTALSDNPKRLACTGPALPQNQSLYLELYAESKGGLAAAGNVTLFVPTEVPTSRPENDRPTPTVPYP